MTKSLCHCLIALFLLTILFSCHQTPSGPEIKFEEVQADTINKNFSATNPGYSEDMNIWKSVYANCVHYTVFPNAIYLGLQTQLGLGTISNRQEINLNKSITVLDTSNKGEIFNLLSINQTANCFSKINLSKGIQDDFYKELVKSLAVASGYTYLRALIDTSDMEFTLGTIVDFSIRPDTLVRVLKRTTDSSLLQFRGILLTPGNAMLIRAGMILGFDAEFNLNRNLTDKEFAGIPDGSVINLAGNNETLTIKKLSSERLRVSIQRNYTIFGQFDMFR